MESFKESLQNKVNPLFLGQIHEKQKQDQKSAKNRCKSYKFSYVRLLEIRFKMVFSWDSIPLFVQFLKIFDFYIGLGKDTEKVPEIIFGI